jgi:GT2 family glycosyltransferase
MTSKPALSVVLAMADHPGTIATTVRHLRRQTIAPQVELVVVTPASTDVSAQRFSGFWGHRIVRIEPGAPAGHASAAGVRAAAAPIVAFAEDHCFPDPGWAEALLAGYTSDEVAMVGPVFRNANPGTLVSWCDFVIGYGTWLEASPAGDRPFLAGHNSSYRRAVLMEHDARLDELLAAETVLHLELRRRGLRLVLEPRATARHTNFARLGTWLPVQYHAGRVFAAERARSWSWWRRGLYAAGSPLIPAVRFVRAAAHLRRAMLPRPSLLRLAPLLALGLAVDGLGQLSGYFAGAGASAHRLADFEVRRIDHVTAADRRLWDEPAD